MVKTSSNLFDGEQNLNRVRDGPWMPGADRTHRVIAAGTFLMPSLELVSVSSFSLPPEEGRARRGAQGRLGRAAGCPCSLFSFSPPYLAWLGETGRPGNERCRRSITSPARGRVGRAAQRPRRRMLSPGNPRACHIHQHPHRLQRGRSPLAAPLCQEATAGAPGL